MENLEERRCQLSKKDIDVIEALLVVNNGEGAKAYLETRCGDVFKEENTFFPKQLPIVKLQGKQYYVDVRLKQMRNVQNPHDTLPLD